MAEDWRCAASRDLPILDDSGWDRAAAFNALWEFAGMDGDNPRPQVVRRGCLAYDANDTDHKQGYHLPFVKIDGGTMKASASGLRNAASRLPQTDIPDSVQQTARDVLDGYFARINAEQSDYAPDERTAEVFLPARVTLRASGSSGNDSLLSLAQARALNAAIFETYPPSFLQAVISNTRLDTYFTHMSLSTLRNYAADASEGVPVLTNHERSRLNIGRSLTGHFVGRQGNGEARSVSDWYVLQGFTTPDGQSTDAMLAGIQSGLYRDISVGFLGGKYICDVCQRDLFSLDCPHYPGFYYDDGGNNVPPTTKGATVATATIEDARLAEFSVVWAGACPGAVILKARQRADLSRMQFATIRQRYPDHQVPEPRQFWTANLDNYSQTVKRNDTPNTEPDRADQPKEKGMPTAEELQRQLDAARTRIGELERERDELRPLADFGRQARGTMIEDALSEGVRAHGNDFSREMYRSVLERADAPMIAKMRGDWAAVAKLKLPGGRQTTDRGEPAPDESEQPRHTNTEPARVTNFRGFRG